MMKDDKNIAAMVFIAMMMIMRYDCAVDAETILFIYALLDGGRRERAAKLL